MQGDGDASASEHKATGDGTVAPGKNGEGAPPTKRIKVEEEPDPPAAPEIGATNGHIRGILQPEKRVCAACNASKMKEGHYSDKQWKKGAEAKCTDCCLGKRECAVCKSSKGLGAFSPEEWAKASANKCIKCANKAAKEARSQENRTMERLVERMCCSCKLIKAKECFDKGQQKIGKKSRCKECQKAHTEEGAARKALESKQQIAAAAPNPQNSATNGSSNASTGEQNGDTRVIKRKTTNSETVLDDGTKIVETEVTETHPDGSTVTRVKRILEKTTNLPDGSKSMERTVTESTVRTKIERIVIPPSNEG